MRPHPQLRRSAASVAWLLLAGLVAANVHVAVRQPGGPAGMSDLAVYVGAAGAMLSGGDLYAWTAPSGVGFTYPPFAAWVLAPLTLLEVTAQRVLWTMLGCGAVVALAGLVAARPALPAVARVPRSLAVPVVAGLLLLSYPVFSGLFLGQVSVVVLLLALLDAVDLTPRWLRGVPTGLAAAVKLTPLVFVPYLWLTGRRRAAYAALAAFAAATGLGALLTPGESRTYWTTNVAGQEFIPLGQADNASLLGALVRLGWTPDAHPLILPLAFALGALAVTLVGYRRARALHRGGAVLAGAVVVGAVGVVVSPIAWSHHQVPLVLAAALPLALRPAWVGAAWSATAYLLLSIPGQALWLHRWPPGHPLAEAVPVLAVAVACLLPFRGNDVARGGRTDDDEQHAGAGRAHRRRASVVPGRGQGAGR